MQLLQPDDDSTGNMKPPAVYNFTALEEVNDSHHHVFHQTDHVSNIAMQETISNLPQATGIDVVNEHPMETMELFVDDRNDII